jgi:class 3 adenylate cyclase/transcriptional regulator with XRE-family HTH domain
MDGGSTEMAAPGEASFGGLLRRYREAAGLTQEELAEAAGLSADAISVLERGVRRAPHRDTVQLLARALALPEQDRTALEASVRRRRGPPRPGAPPPAARAGRQPGEVGLVAPPLTADDAHNGDGPRSAAQPPPRTVPVAGETRALTIVSLDLTASATRSASLSPEDRADRLRGLVQAVAETVEMHGGQVAQVRGEEVLALFGTPEAHENDPERAIVAALALRELGRGHGLAVTAGIDTGTVYLGALGPASLLELTVIGSAADLAARLRQTAQAGQILVGPAAYRQTRRAFAFVPLTLAVKWRGEPLAAYAVVGELAHPQKTRGIEGLRAALVGREHEVALLTQLLAEVRGGRGQLALVSGEAGVGKSRLIAELKDSAFGSTHDAALQESHGQLLAVSGHPAHLLWLAGGRGRPHPRRTSPRRHCGPGARRRPDGGTRRGDAAAAGRPARGHLR